MKLEHLRKVIADVKAQTGLTNQDLADFVGWHRSRLNYILLYSESEDYPDETALELLGSLAILNPDSHAVETMRSLRQWSGGMLNVCEPCAPVRELFHKFKDDTGTSWQTLADHLGVSHRSIRSKMARHAEHELIRTDFADEIRRMIRKANALNPEARARAFPCEPSGIQYDSAYANTVEIKNLIDMFKNDFGIKTYKEVAAEIDLPYSMMRDITSMAYPRVKIFTARRVSAGIKAARAARSRTHERKVQVVERYHAVR